MLQRMLIDKMENRILVGITAFVGIMVLVGWVAINENARMASFERQFEARAIERGAEKFAANCATCHGEDGRGLLGRGPGLNSPHFFGFDYFEEIDNELSLLDGQEADLNVERQELAEQLAAEDLSEARRADIQDDILAITEQINGEGGINAQRAALLDQRAQLAQQLQPATTTGYPMTINDDGNVDVVASRLSQVEWGGTLEQFITTTLIHGRPTSISYWGGNQMVAWSQRAGGPLRDDQIGDLATYILNWDKGDDWTVEDALLVAQYAIVPGVGGAEAVEGAEAAGNDVEAILTQIADEGIVGDPVRGEAIYAVEPSELGRVLACSGCHVGAVNGPAFEGTWDRVVNERLTLPQFEGYTPEQYIIESIVRSGDYIVSGWPTGVMPGNFGEGVSVQDLADLVAYLETTSTQ